MTLGSIRRNIVKVALLFRTNTALWSCLSLKSWRIFFYFGDTLLKPLVWISKNNLASSGTKIEFLALTSRLALTTVAYYLAKEAQCFLPCSGEYFYSPPSFSYKPRAEPWERRINFGRGRPYSWDFQERASRAALTRSINAQFIF